jgi:hypothetical protein
MMTGPNSGSATWLNVDSENPDPVSAVSWNSTKIAAALSDTFWRHTGTQAMICLSAFPKLWADSNASGVLNATFANAWVALAVDLQRIIAGLGVPIAYWEVTNEWDEAYAAVGNTSGLADLVLATAAALRAGDPSTKVRGPAWARPDIWQNVAPFINATLGKLDFYSYHSCEYVGTDSQMRRRARNLTCNLISKRHLLQTLRGLRMRQTAPSTIRHTTHSLSRNSAQSSGGSQTTQM